MSPTIAAEKQRAERDIWDPSDRWEEKELGHYGHLLRLFVAIRERPFKCWTNYIDVISCTDRVATRLARPSPSSTTEGEE